MKKFLSVALLAMLCACEMTPEEEARFVQGLQIMNQNFQHQQQMRALQNQSIHCTTNYFGNTATTDCNQW